MLRFAYSTINWGTTPDLETIFGEIGEAGWEAVELFWHALDWLGTPNRLRAKLAGLQVATLFGAVELPIGADQVTKLKNQIDYAAEIGAEAFGLIGGTRLRWRAPNDEEYAAVAACCEEIAIHGAARGVTVAYHPHVACTIETEAEIDRLMAQTKSLTLCLDASHIALVGEDPLAHLSKYRARTGYIHLKDWARGRFVEMGQGTLGIDFAAMLADLEAQRFGGWVVVEQSRSADSPAASARTNAAFVRSLGYALALDGAR